MKAADVVVGVFRRDQLSTGLVAVHRAGFGPHARVLDSARGSLDAQLERAGHQISAGFPANDSETVLVLISAPGRTDRATDTLTQAGARAVYLAERPSTAPAASGFQVPVAPFEHGSPPAESSER